ncbi:Peroxisome chaperone and import receptor [Coemansia sp. RSA 1933]|nr:Peroxisome chaperone and import receptor [Coemansia sp. RSA 1933]
MSNPPPNDDELDVLLDDAFEQFDAAPPKQTQQKQSSTVDTQEKTAKQPPYTADTTDELDVSGDVNFEEEFARQLAKGMEDLLKESSESGVGNSVNEAEMKATVDQLLKQMGSLQADLDNDKSKSEKSAKKAMPLSHSKAQASETGAKDGSGSEEAQGTSFQDKIKATMDKLKESADRADAETGDGAGDMDVLEELMRQMDGAGGGDDAQLDSLVDDVIGQLMSKEVLEQPLKDLDKHYPKYLEKNKDTLSTEDYERYQKQHDYVKQILALFDQLNDSSVNDERVTDLMQKMQDCGQPPNELLKMLAPDMEIDENGEVKAPEMPNCTIMLKCYCGECVKDRAFQHEWIVGQVRSSDESAPDAVRHMSRSRFQASSTGIEQLYEYQVGRLQARRKRIATLRTRIEAREKLVAEAQQTRDMLAKELERRKARILDLKQTVIGKLDERRTHESKKLKKKAVVCQEVYDVLRTDRGILAKTLCEVVELQLDVLSSPARGQGAQEEEEEEEDPFVEMDTQRRLFGLPWPGSEDWAKYSSDYINACVGHCIHILSVLSHYFHTDLPFYISKRGSGLYIRPNWREVDVGEAELSIRDNNYASFIVGLSMLFFDIAYLCHRQGVRVHSEQITDAIENLRQAVRASRAKQENEARTRLPFMLDVYSVAQEVTKMYAVADGSQRWQGSEDALRKQVNDVLLRLHLCDDAIDSADYEESWAVI